MIRQGLAPHETMEIHEILAFKTVCVGKAATMQAMVKDPQLRSLLEEDYRNGSRQIQELQGLISGIQQGKQVTV